MGVHLWRATSQIERRNLSFTQYPQHQLDGLPIHQFGAVWPRIHVAVAATLITEIPQIYLKRRQSFSLQLGEIGSEQKRPGISHCIILRIFICFVTLAGWDRTGVGMALFACQTEKNRIHALCLPKPVNPSLF